MSREDDTLEGYLAGTVAGSEPGQLPPAEGANLEPLLRAADSIRRLATIPPSLAAIERTRAAIRLAPTNHELMALPVPRFLRGRRPILALGFAVTLLAVGTTSVLASPAALPDSPLYAVRNLREDVQVRLAGTPARRAALYASFATERSAQLQQLARDRTLRPEVAGTLLRDISTRIHQANQEAHDDGPGARSAVQQAEGQIGEQLNQIQQQGGLPGSQEESLTNAIREVQSGQSGDTGGGSNGNQP